MTRTSSQPSWWIYAGLLLAFLTFYYINPFDGARRIAGAVFLLAVILTRRLVVRRERPQVR